MNSVEVHIRKNENDKRVINETKSLPRIASQFNNLSDNEIHNEEIDKQYSDAELQINPFTSSKSKSFPHNNPYSAAPTKNLLSRSKTRLNRSNSNRYRVNQNRPHTTKYNRPQTSKYNRYQQQPKYANWGMKIDSTEALREQILSLKKNLKTVSDENKLIKTEKRRMEKLLRKNDRKLKRLLNTVSNQKSLVKDPQSDNTDISKFVSDENRKYATTELLDMLNSAHNNNISMKRKLHKTETELKNAKTIINLLETQKQEIQCKANQIEYEEYNSDNCGHDITKSDAIIQHLKNQLSEYKTEITECHDVFDKLTKSNDDALHKLDEKDKEFIDLKQKNTDLQEQIIQLNTNVTDLKTIIQNEKFFNNKVLDEITHYKTKKN
eukprot:305110_1